MFLLTISLLHVLLTGSLLKKEILKVDFFCVLRKSLPVVSVDLIKRFLFSSRNIVFFSITAERDINVIRGNLKRSLEYKSLYFIILRQEKATLKNIFYIKLYTSQQNINLFIIFYLLMY